MSRLVVIFVVFIPLAFSEDFLEAAYETARRPQPRWAVLAVDAVLLVLIWAPSLRRRPSGTGKARDPGFLPGWWAVGAVLMLAVDGTVAWILPEGLGVYLGTSLLYIVSLAFILAAIIGADPVRMLFQQRHAEVRPAREAQEAWERFRPAVPLLLGTLAAYVGSQLWGFLLDSGPLRTMEGAQAAAVSQGLIGQGAGLTAAEEAAVIDRLCTGGVDQEYFAQLSQVIPLLLVAVGLEARFFERLLDEPRQRAMTIFAVVMLCVGEALAISALPKSNQGCDDLLSGWHEYTAFVLTLEACFVALATLMWALISPSDQARRERRAFRTRPRLKARRGPTRAGTDRPRRRRPDPP